MSFWTDFRDKTLTGLGLRSGSSAAVALGNIARPAYQQTVGVNQPVSTAPTNTANAVQINNGAGIVSFFKRNPIALPVILIAGAMFFKLKKQ